MPKYGRAGTCPCCRFLRAELFADQFFGEMESILELIRPVPPGLSHIRPSNAEAHFLDDLFDKISGVQPGCQLLGHPGEQENLVARDSSENGYSLCKLLLEFIIHLPKNLRIIGFDLSNQHFYATISPV